MRVAVLVSLLLVGLAMFAGRAHAAGVTTLGATDDDPRAIAIDAAGNVYTANYNSDTVTKITPAGTVSQLGPTGRYPSAIAIDQAGNVYTANSVSDDVTKITPDGTASILGSTHVGGGGVGPDAIALDATGNVYTGNGYSGDVTKITPDGTASIVYSAGGPPGSNLFNSVAVDAHGSVFAATEGGTVIQIEPAGTSRTLVSPGVDGNPIITAITVDSESNVYAAYSYRTPSGSGINTVTKTTPGGVTTTLGDTGQDPRAMVIDAAGNVYTANGNGTVTRVNPGAAPTTLATLGIVESLWSIAIDAAGNLYTAGRWSKDVFRIAPSATPTTFGLPGLHPAAIAVDPAGNIFTTDLIFDQVVKTTPDGTTTRLAGTGPGSLAMTMDAAGNIYAPSYIRDEVTKITPDGTATILGSTGMHPLAITVDPAGNVYTANFMSLDVTKITPDGTSSQLGSTGLHPDGIALDSAGNMYTADYNVGEVTKITPAGASSVLGLTGAAPKDIAVDAAGNVYTANQLSDDVTKITPGGVVSTLGPTGTRPEHIAVDAMGNVYTANYTSGNVTRITPDGTVSTLGPDDPTVAPSGMTIDSAGNVYTANSSQDVTKWSPEVYAAPPSRASAPSAVAGHGAVVVTVTRNAASSRYGAPTSYLVRQVGDPSHHCTVGFTGPASCPITGLTNGTAYTFEVVAQLAGWTTVASASSSPVTPQPPAPDTPATPTAVAGNTQATVTVGQGAGSGGTPTSYLVTSNPDGATCTVTGSSGSCDVTGLTNGTQYVFTATASNGGGTSSASGQSNSVTPMTAASAPTGLVATAGDQSIGIAFVAGANGGSAISNYEYRLNGAGAWTALSPADVTSPVTISGLTNGTGYTVQLRAVTGFASPGAASGATSEVTPLTTAEAPTGLIATAGDQSVDVAFTAGANGGSAITNYQYRLNGAGAWTALSPADSTSPVHIGGLTNGTAYTVELRAVTAHVSPGAGSGPSSAVTPQPLAPDMPATPTAVAGNTRATVAVARGAGAGGTPTSYLVTSNPGSRTCTVTGASGSCDVTGLVNGTRYTFTATATNGGGTSAASSASNEVIPAAPVVPPTPPASPDPPAAPAAAPSPPAPSGGTSAPASAPAPLAARAPAGCSSACVLSGPLVTTGAVPAGATSVVQTATTGSAAMAIGARATARVATTCKISGKGAARTYTCKARLGVGKWTLTTQARAGAMVIAQSVTSITVKRVKLRR